MLITQAIPAFSTELDGRVALRPLVSKLQTAVRGHCGGSAARSASTNAGDMICDTMRVKVCEKVVNCKGLALVRSYIEALVNMLIVVLISVHDPQCRVISEGVKKMILMTGCIIVSSYLLI